MDQQRCKKNSYRVVKFTASSVINWKLNCLPTYIAQSSIRNVWVLKIPVEIIKVIQHASETICFDSFVQCKSLLASDMEIKLHTWSKCLRWNVSSAILIRTNNSKQCVRDWDTCCTLTIHVALFSIKVQIFALENKAGDVHDFSANQIKFLQLMIEFLFSPTLHCSPVELLQMKFE